ncbi:MAG: hypothetical protein P5680_20095 [Limnospira sp. PMC 737.11]|uniref:hypothetical protein n=1 Tax=Limnospira sp. PMC 737.11 TaxID=2981095 RepID=UPI0028E0D5DF|nr:hypothetical protein [Limnospira sp. PMC 737.11]MDT9276879.1 hypothetical protein [Limnospira sp. PMC 737.11]
MTDQPKDWLSISVQEFFNNLNWQGTSQSSSSPNNTGGEDLETLSISVAEFFNRFVWEGTPEVGVFPSKSSVSFAENLPETENDVTIDDLVNLF